MKKYCVLVGLIFLSVFCLFAQEEIEQDLNAYAVIFPGTGTTYTVGTETKNTAVVSMFDSLNDAFNRYNPKVNSVRTNPYGNLVLLGHSQGGMRALAYACKMADNGLTPKGVISIGGPVRGYSPLTGGVGVLAGRIKRVVQDLTLGIDAVDSAFLGISFPFITVGCSNELSATGIAGLIVSFNDDLAFNTVDDIVNIALCGRIPYHNAAGESFYVSDAVIEEMTPGSDYVDEYLIKPKVVDVAAHYNKVPLDDKKVYFWNYKYVKIGFLNIKIWFLDWHMVEQFKYVYIPTTYKEDPYLPASTHVGYIYGEQDDVETFVSEMHQGEGDEEELFNKIKTGCDVAGGVMISAAAINTARAAASTTAAILSYASLNIPAGVAFTAAAAVSTAHSVSAVKASVVLLDINKTVNERIFNTTSADGFVTADSTTLPLSISGGIGWTKEEEPDSKAYDYTHQRLHYDSNIWGSGGSLDNGIKPGGTIYNWLRAAGTDQAIVDNGRQQKFQ